MSDYLNSNATFTSLTLLSNTTQFPADGHHSDPPMGCSISRASPPPTAEGNKRALPPKPSTICQDCWEGPFAAYLGLFGKPVRGIREKSRSKIVGGISFTTTWDPLESRAASGCLWCGFLIGLTQPRGITGAKLLGQLEFIVGRYKRATGLHPHSPIHTQEFVVACNGHEYFRGYVCTVAGGFHARTSHEASADAYHKTTLLLRSSPHGALS